MVIICPRECTTGRTEHCLGVLRDDGKAKCFHCGKWMPTGEALEWNPEDAREQQEGQE